MPQSSLKCRCLLIGQVKPRLDTETKVLAQMLINYHMDSPRGKPAELPPVTSAAPPIEFSLRAAAASSFSVVPTISPSDDEAAYIVGIGGRSVSAKRTSKRLEKLLSVTSLQGGCTPRRRAAKLEEERTFNGGSPAGNTLYSEFDTTADDVSAERYDSNSSDDEEDDNDDEDDSSVIRRDSVSSTISSSGGDTSDSPVGTGSHVKCPDGRVGVVLSSGHGFFTVQLARRNTVKLRGAQLKTVQSGTDKGSPAKKQKVAAAAGSGGATAPQEDPAPAPKRVRDPPRVRGMFAGESSRSSGGSISPRVAVAQSPARSFVGKTVTLPDGRSGIVKSSGHGFLTIHVMTADGLDAVKLRAAQLVVVSGQDDHDGEPGGWTERSADEAARAANLLLQQDQAAAAEAAREAREARVAARNKNVVNVPSQTPASDDMSTMVDEANGSSHLGDMEVNYEDKTGFKNAMRIAMVQLKESESPELMISVGDLVALVCLIDSRRRAAYIVADLKDKFGEKFKYCRITGYSRHVPMASTDQLDPVLKSLGNHSAVDESQVKEYKQSPRAAWLAVRRPDTPPSRCTAPPTSAAAPSLAIFPAITCSPARPAEFLWVANSRRSRRSRAASSRAGADDEVIT